MDFIERTIQASWQHRVFFTDHLFDPNNLLLRDTLWESLRSEASKVLVVVDKTLADAQPNLSALISDYFAKYSRHVLLVCPPLVQPGGEHAKNSWAGVSEIHAQIE